MLAANGYTLRKLARQRVQLAAVAGVAVTTREEARNARADEAVQAYEHGNSHGHQAGYDNAINDAIDNPDAFAARLLEIRS